MRSSHASQQLSAVTIDLDGTLFHSTGEGEYYLLNAVVQWMMTAQASGLPCYIVTARSIYNLLFDTLQDVHQNPIAFTKKILYSSSFKFVLSTLKQLIKAGNPIEIPPICTLYDPYLEEEQQGSYYLECEKVSDFLIDKIDQLLKNDLLTFAEKNEYFLNLINRMRDILYPDASSIYLDLIEDQYSEIPPEIIQLLQTEYKLSFHPVQTKNHQFLWVGKHSSRQYIVHVDDYDQIYKGLKIKNLDDVKPLFPYRIISDSTVLEKNKNFFVSVYCIPFDLTRYSVEILMKKMIHALNFPIIKMMHEFENLFFLKYFCFFRAITERENNSVNWILKLLQECWITSDQIVPLSLKTSTPDEKIYVFEEPFLDLQKKLHPEKKSSKENSLTDLKSSPLELSSSVLINKVKSLPLAELKKFIGQEKPQAMQKLQLIEDALHKMERPEIKKSNKDNYGPMVLT